MQNETSDKTDVCPGTCEKNEKYETSLEGESTHASLDRQM